MRDLLDANMWVAVLGGVIGFGLLMILCITAARTLGFLPGMAFLGLNAIVWLLGAVILVHQFFYATDVVERKPKRGMIVYLIASLSGVGFVGFVVVSDVIFFQNAKLEALYVAIVAIVWLGGMYMFLWLCDKVLDKTTGRTVRTDASPPPAEQTGFGD